MGDECGAIPVINPLLNGYTIEAPELLSSAGWWRKSQTALVKRVSAFKMVLASILHSMLVELKFYSFLSEELFSFFTGLLMR